MIEQYRLDESTYDASRTYLRTVLEHMLEAGRSVRELSEYVLEQFGADFLPYLRQFLHDVGHGRIRVKGLSRTAREALAGHSVSREQRESMIRECAYLRAEARGFWGGSPDQDWLDAEREVDLCLAQGPGLIVKGGQVMAAVIDAMERELDDTRKLVSRWLGDGTAVQASAGRDEPKPVKPRTTVTAKRASGARRVSNAGTQVATDSTTAGGKATAGKAAGKAVKKKAAPARGTPAADTQTDQRRNSATKKKAATTAPRKKTTAKKRAAAGTTRKARRGTTRT